MSFDRDAQHLFHVRRVKRRNARARAATAAAEWAASFSWRARHGRAVKVSGADEHDAAGCPHAQGRRACGLPCARRCTMSLPPNANDDMMRARKVGVLFVCMGNICRSPTAEACFARRRRAGRAHGAALRIDSAGIGDWHVGEPPDARAIAHARRRGYDLRQLRARQVAAATSSASTGSWRWTASNLRELESAAPGDYAGRLGLFLDFVPGIGAREVPDPYLRRRDGFRNACSTLSSARARRPLPQQVTAAPVVRQPLRLRRQGVIASVRRRSLCVSTICSGSVRLRTRRTHARFGTGCNGRLGSSTAEQRARLDHDETRVRRQRQRRRPIAGSRRRARVGIHGSDVRWASTRYRGSRAVAGVGEASDRGLGALRLRQRDDVSARPQARAPTPQRTLSRASRSLRIRRGRDAGREARFGARPRGPWPPQFIADGPFGGSDGPSVCADSCGRDGRERRSTVAELWRRVGRSASPPSGARGSRPGR